MKTIAYFLDKNTFEIKDIVQLVDYEINIDEETNAKTTMSVLKKINASDKDFVFIKEEGIIKYFGIIDAPTNENGEIKYNITAKYITNLFDRKIILRNQDLISSNGIEDFIEYTIKNEFTESDDMLLNKNFIDIEVLTHTKKKFSVPTDHGIYNFHTFITNCTQNYNVSYDFQYDNGRLKMRILVATDAPDIIDTNVTSDIANYYEIFKANLVAKVIVLADDGTETNYYLRTDRTITTNKDDENRAVGDIVVVYEYDKDKVEEAALNQFKGNSYSHLIEFDINIKSKLHNVTNWYVGKPIKIKSKTGNIVDTYISAITKKMNSDIWNVKTGNIRITLLDKLKQEKNKEAI